MPGWLMEPRNRVQIFSLFSPGIYCQFCQALAYFCRTVVTDDWLAVREGEAAERLSWPLTHANPIKI
jgi:hypothetical protein